MENTRKATYYAPDGREYDVHAAGPGFTVVDAFINDEPVHFGHFPSYEEAIKSFPPEPNGN